jgi:hypothetical protein
VNGVHRERDPSVRASQRRHGRSSASALCAALACTLASSTAGAYELRQTSTGAFVRWESEPVPFVVDPSLDAAAPHGVEAAMKAIASWSRVAGGPELVAKVGPGGGKPAVDGQNTILYMPDGYPPAGAALAVTVSTFDVDTGELLDTDIVVNGRYAFGVLAPDARPADGAPAVATEGQGDTVALCGPFDLQHVLGHEVGHALGLADVWNDPHAVMYAYTKPGDASNRVPSPDDLSGLGSLYAGAWGGAGCDVSRVPDGASGAAASVMLSIGALVLVRRRARGARAGRGR